MTETIWEMFDRFTKRNCKRVNEYLNEETIFIEYHEGILVITWRVFMDAYITPRMFKEIINCAVKFITQTDVLERYDIHAVYVADTLIYERR